MDYVYFRRLFLLGGVTRLETALRATWSLILSGFTRRTRVSSSPIVTIVPTIPPLVTTTWPFCKLAQHLLLLLLLLLHGTEQQEIEDRGKDTDGWAGSPLWNLVTTADWRNKFRTTFGTSVRTTRGQANGAHTSQVFRE